jgi:hypothetical protein
MITMPVTNQDIIGRHSVCGCAGSGIIRKVRVNDELLPTYFQPMCAVPKPCVYQTHTKPPKGYVREQALTVCRMTGQQITIFGGSMIKETVPGSFIEENRKRFSNENR